MDERSEKSPPYSSHSARTNSAVQGCGDIKCIGQMGHCRETCRCPEQKVALHQGLSSSSSSLPALAFSSPRARAKRLTNAHKRTHAHVVAAASKTFALSVNS